LLEVLKEQGEASLIMEDNNVKMKDWGEKIDAEMETILGCDVKVDNLRANLMDIIKKKDEDTIKFVNSRIKLLIKEHLTVPDLIGEKG
jgi:hypothetical protein